MSKSYGRHGKRRPSRSFDSYPNVLPLPNASRSAFERRRSPNIGLLFERYTQFQDEWELKNIGKNKPSSKQYLLEQLVKDAEDANDEARKAYADRWQRMVAPAQAWRMAAIWRFVTGVGDKTALEVGFTFQRIHGFPYIPGSSLKGLARSAALLEVAQQANKEIVGLQELSLLADQGQKTPMQKLEEALLEEEGLFPAALREWATDEGYEQIQILSNQFRTVFGTQQSAGQAIFHDAIPADRPSLEVDVMTVHYPSYYQGGDPPADTQNPNPIPFLTVGRTPFWFAVGWRGEERPDDYAKAIEWLKFGLTDLGAGAKTAAGYGYFKELNNE